MRKAALIAVLAGLVAFLSRKAGAASPLRLSAQEVHEIAVQVTVIYGIKADPCMLAAMAFVESGDYTDISAGVNPLATRVEVSIGDLSTGMMQTLLSTAQWLARDMGYDAFGIPNEIDLYDPVKSMYYGAAYVEWLSSYKGVSRSERWIVQSYNGGPAADSGAVRHHFGKYDQAKGQLIQSGVCA